MKSNFEKSAQQAAVDAVEARWARNNATAKRISRGKSLKSFFAYVFLTLILIAGGFYALSYCGCEIPSFDSVDEMLLSLLPRGMCDKDLEHLDSYVKSINRFKVGKIKLWKDAPEMIKPKNASSGLRYFIFAPKKNGGLGLYEAVANGRGGMKMLEIIPTGLSVEITMSQFKESKNGAYLIECGGEIFVCGANSPDAGENLVRKFIK